MQRIGNLTNSYTMEASFAGADFGRKAGRHFTAAHYEEMGHHFCDTILDYCDPDQSKVAATMRELQALNPVNNAMVPATAEGDDSDSAGSDADTGSSGSKGRRRSSTNSQGTSKSTSSTSSGDNSVTKNDKVSKSRAGEGLKDDVHPGHHQQLQR